MTKELKSTFEKCETCGGDLKFDPKTQTLICGKCGMFYDFPKDKKFKKHPIVDAEKSKFDLDQWKQENRVIACKNCGARVILNNLEFAATCPYCKSNSVIETDQLPGIKPDEINPFAFNEKDAEQKFIDEVKKKFFVPSKFKKSNPKSKIQGIYIPGFSFDAGTISTYKGMLYEHETHRDSQGRSHTTISYKPISGTENMVHKDVMIEASTKITQSQLDGILPFKSENTYRFDQNFVRGYFVEHYDTDTTKCYETAKAVMDKKIRKQILSHYSYDGVSYLNVNTTYFNEYFLYRISPIYTFEFDYKRKKRVVLMNGQTGKLGKGLPKSGWKITFVVIIIVLIVAAIAAISIYFSN